MHAKLKPYVIKHFIKRGRKKNVKGEKMLNTIKLKKKLYHAQKNK